MEFVYKNSRGEVKTHRLANGWQEQGKYIIGYSETDAGVRTFLIYRILEYIGNSASFLAAPIQHPPPPKRPDERSEILFTGFPSAQRRALESFSAAAGMKVVQSVTNGLDYLCVGPNAGPTKVTAARSRGLFILTECNLKELVDTGVLPDHEPDFI